MKNYVENLVMWCEKLFLLCLLLSLNAFAQEKDSTSVVDSAKMALNVRNVDPAILLDSVDYYQDLVDDVESEISDKPRYYVEIGLGVAGIAYGAYFLNSIAAGGGAGYAIGVGVIPIALIVGGVCLSVSGLLNLRATNKLSELVAGYEKRRDLFTERFKESIVEYSQDSGSVDFAYLELLKDDFFRGLKKKAQCREKTSVSDFYQCVGNLYDEAAIWSFTMGGVSAALETAYVIKKSELATTICFIPLIGVGITYIVYGGLLKSKANEIKAMAEKAGQGAPSVKLAVVPIVDPFRHSYGGVVAFNF